mgnify:CR=1 FL=1
MSVPAGCFRTVNLVLLAFLAGCGGGGGGGGGSGGSPVPPDTTLPTVTDMSPGEDIFGIGTNTRLAATLSEAMVPAMMTEIDPATNHPANFRLTNGADSMPGTVGYDATNSIAVFTPTGGLAPNTRYTATIVTGIKDLGNNPLTTDFAWCFVTGDTADSTAPNVTSTLPANAAAGVAINRRITATFSEPMNSSTITPASFTVTGPGVTPVPGAVTYLGRTAVFAPANGLASNTAYTATIAAGVMDLAGNASQANVAWSFSTGANADITAPVVVSTNPAGAEPGVAISRTINISFNEPMDPSTMTTANFKVTGPGTTSVIGTVAFDATNNTATFTRINHLNTPVAFHLTPVSHLEPNTTYTATLTTGARDLAGNALAANRVWSFTTAP